jgi:LDH2 family malate/lactate/ureidoglycolate dehydrogenase
MVRSKLEVSEPRVLVMQAEAMSVLRGIFLSFGCKGWVAQAVADHLVDSSLSGVESHGIMRVLQYADQFDSGYMTAGAVPEVRRTDRGMTEVDGGGGHGVPAMVLAYETVMDMARETGVAAVAVRHVGHTGRHGAFADAAAENGFVTILIGGGNRKVWRQVAPFGGAKALLPTNPYCIGVPGGERGPVVLDFATSMIAGGWIYAAKSAGGLLPEGCVIDRNGQPTRDPQDYFDGGAILPAGAQKGYAMALVAELIAEAVLGPVATEANWLLVALEAGRWQDGGRIRAIAEEILCEIRECPPAPGFERVEVPGERERDYKAASGGVIAVPSQTWAQILALAKRMDG